MSDDQGNLFDMEEGMRLREEGIARVLKNNDDWKMMALALLELSDKRLPPTFTSEDLIRILGMPSGHPSAVGGAVAAAARHGSIRWTGRMRNAMRPKSHGAILKEWEKVQ